MGSSPSAPASPAAVTIHIGAHKTASTHLQKTLLLNRDTLAAQGCAYFGPDRLRRDLKIPGLHRKPEVIRHRIAPLLKVVQRKQADGQRLLLSDENIMGGGPKPPTLVMGGMLYPKLQSQISTLLDVLELQNVTIGLALRNPADLLISAWGHQCRLGAITDFAHFSKDVALLALRWSDVVARLQDCRGVKRVTVWRHEDYSRLVQPLLVALTGCSPDTGLKTLDREGGDTFLVGPSARALELAPKLLADKPGLDPKTALRRAMRLYPKSTENPAAQPLAPDAVAQAKAQYQADWDTLARQPGVSCLTP